MAGIDQDLNIDAIVEEELEENPTSYKEVIETVISSLEENDSAMVMHTDEGDIWKFEYGTVEVLVKLTGENDDDTLTVWAKILDLPVKDELGLMRTILKMNWSGTFETCFGLFEDQVVVLYQRIVEDLNPGEISRAITLVATIADENDETLKEQFG